VCTSLRSEERAVRHILVREHIPVKEHILVKEYILVREHILVRGHTLVRDHNLVILVETKFEEYDTTMRREF
jgi:hypothetical protein